ncbi:acetyltransferase, GNAT family [Streptococcus gallolyticus subsp. gallolyticus ATCC BAA-2069]|uniref:GNAT family N-acetyltransferase n=1 Tax=Streptococcus gallolyticus TaxID=315405 RepID=UPI000201B37E|nr:GNAT family N-acetyltransferase [Streptococcus gallolyticus]MCF1634738.1 GNAT family N-acetyltransferase [Streptococcus gallolyticus]CBZ49097.1 acetyltransferase, GNAT family [Streptococcus gallolyticus subsp. gallolyticus ATCC BAA-2069]
MQISIFEPKFNQAVIDLILTIQQEEFSLPISLTEQPDLLDIENSYQKQGGQFWVAINERKEVLGCIGLVALEQDNVALKKMFVSKNYRKAGLGKKLLKAFVAYCQKEQKKAIFLGTTTDFEAAQHFYRKFGFQSIESSNLPADFPRLAVDNRFYTYIIN